MSDADARAAITELIYRYAELIDAGDFDGLGALLGRAAFGGPKTPTVSGASNIAGLFAMTTKRFTDSGTPKTRHLVLNLVIEIDGDTATARSTFCVVQATDRVPLQPIVVGRYYDRFARAGARDGDRFARADARDGDTFARADAEGWYFTERIADVEMAGDVSDHLLIDPATFGRGGI